MNIKKVAVIGSGTMGCGIAAQVANAGIPVYLLDLPVAEGSRNQIVENAKENGIIITTHYKGLHQLRTGETLTNSEMISSQIINLFVKPETSIEQIHNTIAYINNFDENS